MTSATKSRLGWPEVLSVAAAVAAVLSITLRGGVLSALMFGLCAFLGWSRVFEENAATGRRTVSGRGRIAAGVVFAILGITFLPKSTASTPETSGMPHTMTFGKFEAVEACKQGVARRAAHPSTIEFPALDYDFREHADGKSQLLMSAKARNGFNLLVEFDVECDFVGAHLDDLIMSEAAPS
jgi:hypothetical protein